MMEIKQYSILNIHDLYKIKDQWETLENGSEMTVYQTFEWNLLLCNEWFHGKTDKLTGKIVLYLLYENEQLCAILPLIIQKISTRTKWFGRNKGIYILGYGSYSDYLNMIYTNITFQMFDELVRKIQFDYPNYSLHFTDIREDTSLFKYLKRKEFIPAGESVSVAVVKPAIEKEYISLLSKHTRQNLRTALNRMNTDKVRYELQVYGSIHDKKLLDTLRQIHIKRMRVKNTITSDFIHTISSIVRIKVKKYRELNNNIIYQSMQSMQNSCLVVIYLNDEIAGYLYGLRDKNIIRIMQNCFDEKYKFYSPSFRGAYDFVIQCFDKDIECIDFTRGDEDYKYKLGGIETKLYEYVI